ncbi:3-hydroxyacyl-CoA dehydrogenase NAD-binding domain-containing protein [uncultured Sphingomonas sp.]|uniref:3-hydroxyacyl-CoA dehydrogenase NAD-binding domain-containing protein n=1 Tax=uncultured Sphingomonas sp. TaxID=158754 RepID=UPI0026231254|nr:3-hydroxyacyl-CoA dehydrogenase NAD-binding domain-containing protein [uncultured Sphingomonas sp.]
MAVITTRKEGDVLVVVSDNPPVNALGADVRIGLVEAIRAADADSAVAAVVIRGAGRTFFAGADITEFGAPMRGPQLPEVVDIIEACTKPVVAAIHGTALGGGLEVALACHYRVAVPSAKLGLPEVKLGILPGAGGTQRLPRVVGVEAALPMIVSGDPIPAKTGQAIGLIDRIVGEDSLEADAIAFARDMAAKGGHPVASRGTATAEPGLFDHFRKENARRLKGYEAPEACIQAIEAATTLPFDQGMAKERALFTQLVSGTQSQALRHIFFAERAAAKINDIPKDTPLIPIRKVGILGAGTMGGGIAMNFLSAGIPVTIVEREQAALDRGVATIRRNYEATASKGRMTAAQVETATGLLTPTLSYDDLADCDLVIEAVFELMAIKKDVFGTLDRIVKPGAILASNTSYLDVDEIAAATKRPESVIGLHFFSPANVMKLLEIVRGAKTAPSVLATCMALSKTIKKVAVVAGVCDGFIGNRMLSPRQREANALVMEGATPADVDRVLLDFGFPMGPFQMSDLAGLDIGWDPDASDGAENFRDALCEAGLRGQKNGHGFYDYDDKRNRTPSPKVEQLIREFAAKKGIAQRTIDSQEILERLLYPMVNEGALILEEKMAQRASDIDIVWLNGYGWPAWTGGPMFWADTVGLDVVVAGLEKHAPRMAGHRLSTLLADKAAKGERFTS